MKMTPRMGRWMRAEPWLVGVLLSTVAMFLGFDLGSETARLLGGEPGLCARLAKGLVWGGVLSGLQWPIVRAIGVRPVQFISFSAACFAAGYPLGQTIQGLMVLHWGLNWGGYWAALAAFGLSLGMPQWCMLRRHVRHSSLWILFSVTGWMLVGLAWISFRAGDGLDSIVFGIVAGSGLAWLASSRRPIGIAGGT